jgi:hypothetical protein
VNRSVVFSAEGMKCRFQFHMSALFLPKVQQSPGCGLTFYGRYPFYFEIEEAEGWSDEMSIPVWEERTFPARGAAVARLQIQIFLE